MRPKIRRKPVNDNKVRPCYLYVIGMREGGIDLPYSKLGISDNVDRRIRDMTTGTPFDIFCEYSVPLENRLAALAAETKMHIELDGVRVRGEWFRIPPPDAAAIGGPTDRVRLFFRYWNSYAESG